MTFASHVFLHACYGLAAFLGALWLGRSGALAELPVALPAGMALFAAAAVLHEALVRRRQAHALGRRLERGIGEQARAVRELQRENRTLAETVLELRRQLAADGPSHSDLIRELRTLHGELSRLGARRGAEAGGPMDMGMRRLPGPAELDDDGLLDQVRRGLQESRVDLHLQPIVTLPQRRPRHVEAFARIRTEDGRVLPAERYMPLSDGAGLAPVLDNLLLFRCVQLVRRRSGRGREVVCFLRLSPKSLADAVFFDSFVDFLQANRSLAGRLAFVLGAEAMADGWAEVAQPMHRLAELGYAFALDRLDERPADLADLARRNVRYLKVDAALLLAGRFADAEAFGADLGDHGIELIAEGVAAERSVPELLDCGVALGQGDLFGPPRPAAQLF